MFNKIIKTEEEYNQALARLEEIFDSKANTPEGDEAELLMLLVERYEEKNYPIPDLDPITAIYAVMEEHDLKQKDLVGILGNKARVSEVLRRKKRLTVPMIHKLVENYHIPASTLVKPYELQA